MSCTRCGESFFIKNVPGKIYFLSEFEELTQKFSTLLSKLSLEVSVQQGILFVQREDTYLFFQENIDAFKNYFNELECEDIKIYIAYEGDTFTFQSVLSAKPLKMYINYFDDRDFFDIIKNESLTSHFQPIVDMNKNEIYGYEMLVRGVKENGKLMYPDELFLKSQQNNYNFRLDRLCRETALKTAATKKISQKVFINFLPTSIYDPEFCLKSTVKWAKQLDFDPSQIVFEVVETELVKNQNHLKEILKYYRSKGFKIALDDVGEGYSSLNMLIELQPDIIKVDRNIISDIDTNELKESVYKALYSIAKEHDIKVLAEGVETPYELEKVKSLGVDLAQGYYFAKPSSEPIRKVSIKY
jgi:EAL domain-containing protein (putative c-di-GMP-specific phosphodiesterase class I)